MKSTVLVILLGLFVVLGSWRTWIYFLPKEQTNIPMGIRPESNQMEGLEVSEPVEYRVEVVVGGLEVPWSMVFTSNERMLVSERPGRIREIKSGDLTEDALLEIKDISTVDEEGLMGMALHPDYATNKQLYACYAYKSDVGISDKVVLLEDWGEEIRIVKTILDEIPAAKYHAGCGVKIGPDKKLYVSSGDGLEKERAQDLDSLAGKVLRLNLDGSVPDDNPWPGSLVYSYGHRNIQGFDWHPVTSDLWATEHGPTVIDGPAGGDEINLIIRGGNYGWPIVSHERSAERMISPLAVFTPALAPSGAVFYDSSTLPQFKNDLFFGALKGEGLYRVRLSEDYKTIESYEKFDLKGLEPGRVRAVTVSPDGLLYFTSSNLDGRGKAKEGDDKIWRVVKSE